MGEGVWERMEGGLNNVAVSKQNDRDSQYHRNYLAPFALII